MDSYVNKGEKVVLFDDFDKENFKHTCNMLRTYAESCVCVFVCVCIGVCVCVCVRVCVYVHAESSSF